MKITVLFFLLFIGIQATDAQVLKKKYCGEFTGEVPAYTMDFQGETVEIKTTSIQIRLFEDGTCELSLNGKLVKGNYSLKQEDNTSFTFLAQLDKNSAPEEWILYKKDKRLERKGVYPQPNAILIKKS